MEAVITALAIVAVISWAVTMNWKPIEQMPSDEVPLSEKPSELVMELNPRSSEMDPCESHKKFNLSPMSTSTVSKDEYEYWKREGDRLRVSKAYLEAIAAYEQALTSKPNAGYAWQQRGEVLKRIQRYDDAIASYQKAIEVSANPISRYQAWNGLGALLFSLEKYEESIVAYKQALALCPNGMGSPHILEMEGIAWSKLNRYDEAGDCYTKAYDKAVELSEKTLSQINYIA